MFINYGERIMRPLLLAGCALLFLIIPLKIVSYGYLPGDDALRHTAFAVDHRHWNEVLVLNQEFRPELDSHPGWHALLRFMHQNFGLDQEQLVEFSVILSFVTFTWVGMAASGNPLAWLCTCGIVAATEYSMFHRFLLGRPMFFSMTAMTVMLFVWTRAKPLKIWVEGLLAVLVLTFSIYMHPTVWYLWFLPGLALVLCKRWHSGFVLGGAIIISMCLAAVLLGSWYNVFVMPILVLKLSVFQDPLVGTNLVSELQPSGGPFLGLLIVGGILFIKRSRGHSLREELSSVSFVVMVISWLLGLSMLRFWVEWGLPASAVWICCQFKEIIKPRLSGLTRVTDTIWLASVSALAFYFVMTVDIGGRYTQNLKSPLLTKPLSEYRSELPDDGGVLYSTDMTVFYKLYFRIPDLKFRFSTGFEPGFMSPENLKVLRAIQFSDGQFEAYEPWLKKMTDKDRLIMYYAFKPSWPGMEFKAFYSAWIGRKVVTEEKDKAVSNPLAVPQNVDLKKS